MPAGSAVFVRHLTVHTTALHFKALHHSALTALRVRTRIVPPGYAMLRTYTKAGVSERVGSALKRVAL